MKLIIVGGVAGGASAAARMRRLDEKAEIVLFERGDYVSFANCGLPYHMGGVIVEREKLLVMPPERFRGRLAVDLRLRHEVVAINRAEHTVRVLNLATGEETKEAYDKLLLATGSSPVRPPLPGVDDPDVLTLWTMGDMDAIKARAEGDVKRAVVVGGGFIGLEAVENLRHRGVAVTLVELLPHVLPTLDAEMAGFLNRELAQAGGVTVRLGAAVERFERDEKNQLRVHIKGGEAIEADLVVLSVGVRPNSLLARDAGLAVGERGGIVTDGTMRTSDPDIYAVGDAVQVTDPVLGVPTQIPLAGPANRQGRLAADALAGLPVAPYRGTWGTAIVKVFGLTAASVGASEKALRRAGVAYEKIYLHPFSHATYYPGAQPMHLKLLFAREGRILGAQIVGGEGVDKRIDVLATAMQAGLTVSDLERLELAYAPPFSSAKDPVNFAGYVAGNVLAGKTRHVFADALPPDAVLLDVRDAAEVESGVIPGAVAIPLGQLRKRLGELPRDRKIVAYCAVGLRGYLAEQILRPNGFDVYNLSGGMASWRASRVS
jgi:NADPH-dependent 2,4-dienoyl-CoA reductase/sulfur reductase-like enzyme/rhodanese-related sulfurtransferase